MNHTPVKDALAAGIPAEAICATCPWDRLCLLPPNMSSAEIDRRIKESEAKDLARDPGRKNPPVGMLMTALVLAGRDTSATLCPVFAVRLSGPDGRRLADSVREQMRGWGD